MARFAICSLVILGCVLSTAAQQTRVLAPHRPIPPRIAHGKVHGEMSARTMVGGLWMVDPNIKSTLYLKNNVETSAIAVTPVLHLSNGAQYALPDVNLEPAGTALVSISDGLQSKGVASWAPLSGYVELRYNWPWDALCATIRNLDTLHSTIFMYSIPSALPVDTTHPTAKAENQTFEGLWWKQEANVTGFVSLLNTSSQAIQVDLQLLDNASNVFANHATTVSPHGMKRIDLEELLTTTSSDGGIRVTYSGQKNDLQIYGGLQDPNVGYSAKLPFAAIPDASAQQNSLTIAELGLMAGAADPMMSFPVGTTFTPYSVLRNTSNAPISVTPTLWWMQGGAPHSASSPALTLLSHQSNRLDVMSLISSAGLKNFNGAVNLMLDVQGKTSGLIAVAGSIDQANTYVFEVIPKAILESASKSLSYWSTGNGDDTMVTLWNPADEAQDFSFKLFYTGGHYAYPIHLGPKESRTFNISEIIHSQIPDAEGNTVPVSVQDGSATISGGLADNQHILIAMDAGTYNVKKATCGFYCQSCDGLQSYWFEINSFSVGVSHVQQEFLKDQWYSGQQHDLSSNSTWSSNNTSRATVSGGNVTGVSAGSVTIGANYTSSEPVGGVNVCEGGYWSCPVGYTGVGGSGNGCVGSLNFNGTASDSIFVGTDVNILSKNVYFLTLATGTPTGGTYTATSSDGSDTISLTDFAGMKKATVTTTHQSTTVGDRTLTFTYTPPSCGAMGLTKSVTAKAFSYLTNNSPSNTCGLAHGTDRTYVYTVHTHPDGGAIDGTYGDWSGTPDSETFNPNLTCTNITGNGGLDSNGQISDHVASACSSQPLTCSQTTTQSLSVTGIHVRSNTLQWDSNGVNYTNNGPTQ